MGRVEPAALDPACPPSWPTETCVFCAWMAGTHVGRGQLCRLTSLAGSSQMRIAYCAPNTCGNADARTR